MHPLGGLGLRMKYDSFFRARIYQPIINRHAIARRLGNLVSIIMNTIAEMLWFFAAKNFTRS
jgi:hypothetical protein